mmetsp:Transcript_24488/g.68108  ORF Transcript_24488/g.68108 Transcript_24488/m.68108 type:complete len:344 (+) Transcript_24488:368-1399(+)|eukprot:CAMPEP_0117672728 /NCGR_PEP_ID=MMETSP0804-20121206/14072_1 /TAXON_ID=1074897 /ORGANISM="Tetraselmis astigmatica, Strain CCMP880" /LENGTH=343 /DNA_ID=CAMNT_0005481375 /DNA_START=288 /DNA_END=1319 /DNA_ORIENTATION=+
MASNTLFLHQGTCACEDGANEFIRKHFCDCVYNTKDLIAFSIGLSSILIWLMAQMPQLMENHRNKKAEALSIWFLVDWLMGDACNLIGCLATGDQLATQVYTAVYFVVMDCVILLQWTYYNALNSRIAREQRAKRRLGGASFGAEVLGRYQPLPGAAAEAASEGDDAAPLLRPPPAEEHSREAATQAPGTSTRLLACVCGGMVIATLLSGGGRVGHALEEQARTGRVLETSFSSDLQHDFGIAIGYISSVFYVKGRISQIWRNCARRTTEGLSALMFINAILGNVTYGVAIFMRLDSPVDLLNKMPWLIGSLGTVFLDVTILLQEVSSRMHHQSSTPASANTV